MVDLAHAHWRDSSRNPRFFFLDAISALPFLLFLLHMRAWTFYLAIFITIFFAILERFNFTIPVFKKWLRSYLAGPIRISNPHWRM